MSERNVSTPRGHVYRDSDWPHGLRCAECHHLFTNGQTYEGTLDSMFADGTPIELILCVACAERVAS